MTAALPVLVNRDLQSIKGEDEQVVFLLRHQASVKGFKGTALIDAFKSLNGTCKTLLREPVYLTLFCAIFQKSPQVVKKWKNEVTILNDFLSLSKQTMIDRMNSMKLVNPECYADDMTTALFDLSLCLLLLEEMTLIAKTYNPMCRDIFRDAKVEYYPIVSTFFTKHPDQQTFEFYHKSHAEFLSAKAIAQRLFSNPAVGVVSTIQAICSEHSKYFQDGAAPSPHITDVGDVSLKRLENVLRFLCMLIHEGGPPMEGALKRFLAEVSPALVKEKVGLDYWTNLVLGCPDSDQVIRAAAEAAHTVSRKGWKVQSSRAMTATSKMLPYRQPAMLDIDQLRSEKDYADLAVLLEAVTHWHTGGLHLTLNESHDNYSACDASLACLESARCELRSFRGCLSGGCSAAWRALRRGAERGRPSLLYISLLDPKSHELGQLDGTAHYLYISVRMPSSPGDRRRRPLPISTTIFRTLELRVECRPAAEGGAPGDEGATAALIEDLAPKDMMYLLLFLLHYPGLDGALDGMVATLRARGVRTGISSNTRGWEEVSSISGDERCYACGDASSHRPGERCVRLYLGREEQTRRAEDCR